ncbi:EAL domain-containing protein [uncultured Lamprocystis sp.]|jgi:DNA-binding response OmpR family regulator/EAL domain-containing protein (putative c-di-GMP-specific phosphodiesterase class I)|uniref:EAL domain-containing protein n=1 Tax=uncultured Lamprocystis sp. TaxID=543132 RepID=UPI0025F83C14|nr:EAL domain-containing protein [uncultured Lamprocystis sp.]
MNHPNPTRPARGTILLLSRDTALIAALGPHLSTLGFLIDVHGEPDLLRRRLAAAVDPDLPEPPLVLLLVDLRALADSAELASLVGDHDGDEGPCLPLVCLGQEDDLQQRLAAMRAGAAVCLSAILEPAALAARVASLVALPDGGPERVLVVDDQPVAALFAARVLEHAGLIVERVHDPLEVLAALERFAPNLVLMDLHMPGVNGIELTGVIRGQERYADLPILFLSGELDPGRQLDALRIGGDDFLAKPVSPQRLVASVRERLVRSRHRLVRGFASEHAVTGLAGREHLFTRLDRLLRAGSPAHWALLYFEQPGNEAVMTRLGAAVSARLGEDGLAARVGEHGVAALLSGGDERAVAIRVEALAQGVHQDLAADAAVVDRGVGWCPVALSGGEAITLLSRARKVARLSLHRGQGRVECYASAPIAQVAAAQRNPLLDAVAAGRFQLLFQPMVPLRSAPTERYEATLRLNAPDGELLGPSVFAPLALRAGQAATLDRWLLCSGLDALYVRREAGRPVELFLHQSLAGAADPTWVDGLRDAISARDLIAFRPIIQFQVADADRHLDLAVSRAGQLDRLGIRLCLNGLTGGERGERVLERLPAAFVRLARETAHGLPGAQLEALVGRIHERQALVIATGVEGPDTIARLFRAGVDLIQGTYVQPPAESMEFDFAALEAG